MKHTGISTPGYRLARPPAHLTEFGVWLWWRVPVLTFQPARCGEGFLGLRNRRLRFATGIMANYYHGMWPWSKGVPYWRRSIWVAGLQILIWRRS